MHHPTPSDLIPVAVLGALLALEIAPAPDARPRGVLLALAALAAVPLAWRRTSAVAASGAVMASAIAMRQVTTTGYEVQSVLLCILLAAFSVGAYRERRAAVVGLGVTWLGLVLLEAGDVIVLGPLATGAWAVGRILDDRETDARGAREHAARTEEEAAVALADERARIARDLHDIVAHSVSVMVVQAGAERLAADADSARTQAALAGIEQAGREALVELRRMLGVLRDPVSADDGRRPTVGDLAGLAENVRRAGLAVELSTTGHERPLPPGVDISAYRIIQEALTNALRHAGAGRADVTLRYGDHDLDVEVRDDGNGSGLTDVDGSGHGLIGMRERATVLGGRLEAGDAPDGGFVVRARLPLEGR